MNKEELKESICSCSPKPYLHQSTSSVCSSSATSAFSSSNIRQNLRKRKRMSKRSMADKYKMLMIEADNILGEETTRKLQREGELRKTWESHHEELINLLEAHCNGEHNLGNTKDKKFWKMVTNAMVTRYSLKLNVDEETCESCMKYVQSLHKVFTDYKGKSKAIEKNQKARSNLASPEFVSGLRRIFSEKISFKRASSVGKTSMTSRRSSSAKRRSNSSVNKDVEAELHDALAELAHSGDLKFNDIGGFEQYVTKCKTSLHIFITGNKAYRLSVVHEYLGINSQETEVPQTPCDL